MQEKKKTIFSQSPTFLTYWCRSVTQRLSVAHRKNTIKYHNALPVQGDDEPSPTAAGLRLSDFPQNNYFSPTNIRLARKCKPTFLLPCCKLAVARPCTLKLTNTVKKRERKKQIKLTCTLQHH